MTFLFRLSLAASLAIAVSAVALADKRDDETKKQKAAGEGYLKSAKLTAAFVETNDLLVYGTIPEDKAKPLAAAMQKSYAAAVKVLKVESSDKLWPGKLSAFVFADTRQYKSFSLLALKRSPERLETNTSDLKADVPYVLDGIVLGEKPTDMEVLVEASALVAAAVLVKHTGSGGDKLPEWMQLGFGHAAFLRSEGNSARLTAHKAKVKALYAKTQGKAFKVATVTGGQANADSELLGTSLAEYMAFGPGAAKFPMVLTGLRPTDEQPNPTFDTALAAAEWKWEALEPAWQRWVTTGK